MVRTGVLQQVDEFLSFCAVERNLSTHTVAAYRRDLDRYAQFLVSRNVSGIADVTESDLSAFQIALATGKDGGGALTASSIARTTAAVRGLHRFAVRERWVGADITRGITTPTAARKLPKALTLDEVERLIGEGGITCAVTIAALAITRARGGDLPEIPGVVPPPALPLLLAVTAPPNPEFGLFDRQHELIGYKLENTCGNFMPMRNAP